MTSVRLLSYNVRSLRDDASAVSRVIRSIDPDVALIQEAPRFLRWRSKCAALARTSGMVVVCGGRVTGANLILSSLAVDVLATREIGFTRYRNLHQRGAVLAVLSKGGTRFAVAGTHLDLIEVPRLRHLDELDRVARQVVPDDVPLIVGGDVNAVPGSATWSRLERFGEDVWARVGDGDGFSYPSRQSVRRIDAFFADTRVKATAIELVDTADVHIASDHKPLVADFDL